ncbi:tetratricopeptide repeat-containing protein [Pholiota molesta]|nr:tetratricopeptide repeat-containing protein [Pholiota molesta]
MASQPTQKRKRDPFKFFSRRKAPQPPGSTTATPPPPPTPIPPQLSNDKVALAATNAPDIPLAPVAPQKVFAKSKMFEKDIAVLSMSYIIAENPELKKLIHLIVGIHAKDEQDQLTGVLATCAQFSVQLISATEAHRAEATEAITEFIKTVEKLNSMDLKGSVQSLDTLKRMVDDEIAKVKSSNALFAHDRDCVTSERLSRLLTAIISPSITILTLVKDAGSVIPVPWIQGVIGGVLNLLNAVKQTRSNYDDMRQIAATAGEFAISCAVICSDRTTEASNELKRALNKFTKSLEGIAQDCDELTRQNRFWRYFQQNVQKDTLQGIRTRLDNAIKVFQNESQIHIQLDVNELSKKFDYVALNGLPSHPRYDHAEYLDGSRDDVLREISDWIDKRDQSILWIHGAAGLGKSTTGQQLVRLLKDDNCLAGGVFLTNLTKEHPETVIQMISRQLGEMHPRAIANIAEAARKLNGPHNPLRDYLTAYVIDPIRQLEYPYPLVVVMDGLEEWTSHESFLAELAHLPAPSPVKFILTSRPSYSVERVLNKIPSQAYPLPPVSEEIIERYFRHHFETIDWRGRRPDQLTISRLATHAQGLLIWAATVRSLLSHEFDQRYPHQILEQIVWSEEKVGARSGEQLERLYRDAIINLFPKPDMQEKLQDFLGAMMVLQEPLPLGDFARLLPWGTNGQISNRPAEEIQRRLAVFQMRGEFKSDIIPPAMQQFHLSFLEFMQSTSTESNERCIAISAKNAHSMVAKRCLEIVFSEFLQSHRGKVCAYSELRGVDLYAIKFWPLHVSNGSSRLPPATLTTIKDPMDMISQQDMRRWATLFLPCITARFQDAHAYDSLDEIPRSVLPHELALMIGDEDVTTLLYQLYCLEIAVRLQATDIQTWIALGDAYDRLYEHGRNIQSLDEAIIVYRHALLIFPALHSQSSSLAQLAFALKTRFEQQGAQSDLDEAISFNREVLLLQPAPHPDRSSSLNDLGNALLTRSEQQGAPSDLEEAISLHREAIVLRPAPHPDRSWSLNNLGDAFLTRFEQQGVPSNLEEAISLHCEAILLRPAPHPDRSMSLSKLGMAVLTRFEQQGVRSDLDKAISSHREALLLWPAPHPDRSSSLNDLGNALLTRSEQQGAPSDLEEAISLHREAILLRPAPHPDRSTSLSKLGMAILTRFEQQGVSSDLDEAISLHREALLLRPAPHPDRSSSLNDLGNALLTRSEQQGAPSDLEEAISLHREAILLQPAPHPDRSRSLNNLGDALLTRFEQQHVPSNLDEAISLHREALLLRPAPHPNRSSSLNHLGNALLTCSEQQHAPSDLEEAISLHHEAILLRPAPHPDRSWSLNNLGDALLTRFEQQGVPSDLDKAISLHREALLLRPAPHPDRSSSLNNLGNALLTRSEQQGAPSDVDEAISLHREALLLRPAPHPDRSSSLNNLGNALLTRSEQQGAPSDVDEAISLHREALLLRPAPHPDHSMSLSHLGMAIHAHFKHQCAPSDLEEAISLHREAILLQPAPHRNRSLSLHNLGDALLTCYEQQGVPSDLEEAISLLRQVVLLEPARFTLFSMTLNNLGNALLTRFEQQGTPSDLEEAISLHREAILLRPAPHPDRAMSFNNLGNALLTRFEQQDRSSDLDEAIFSYREALLLCPAPHQHHSEPLQNLAKSLQTRFKKQGTIIDQDEADSLRREAKALNLKPSPH